MWKHVLFGLLILLAAPCAAAQTELATLSEAAWSEWAPRGKEVDCIYGDLVLRNEHMVVVIARPSRLRNANMTVRDVGGMIIDLTRRAVQSDQLSAYYAGGGHCKFHQPRAVSVRVDGKGAELSEGQPLKGDSIEVAIKSLVRSDGIQATIRYTLDGDSACVRVETIYSNTGDRMRTVPLRDSIRADRTFGMGVSPAGKLFWAYDPAFGQAYGCQFESHVVKRTGGGGTQLQLTPTGATQDAQSNLVKLAPGEQYKVRRRLIPGAHLLEVRGIAARLAGDACREVVLQVTDPAGPVHRARVVLQRDGKAFASGRTDEQGQLRFLLGDGSYTAKVQAIGRPARTVKVDFQDGQPTSIELEACGYVEARIKDAKGNAIPCKVTFQGAGETADPFFGPDSGTFAVGNARYTANGKFRQELAPGKYNVIVSHGPEYDATFTTVEIRRAETTVLEASLKRTVDTRGWISADFHSHSSPSGDNTGSQFGRVLNLLAEHIEFGPCTEHNRINSYSPHLRRLNSTHLLATCTGIELTGNPLPINHQNAFPLVHKPHTQDGGGPVTDTNPVVQIERLAFWDNGSDKLVQGNHPRLVQMLSDRNQDGKYDGGFEKMFDFMDVVEVHPPTGILTPPSGPRAGRADRNPIFHWLQMLNLGYRTTGVVNTDAHYNFHGSGWLRNYLHSSTDDPAKVKTMDMVHSAEQGHVMMTTGPFLEAAITAEGSPTRYLPGDDVSAHNKRVTLHIRVQCANWLDINRVLVVLNGRHGKNLNFRRRRHADKFGRGVVKFEASIPLELTQDTHVIVVAAGEGLRLGPVMGDVRGKAMPIAVTNPIFVDVDGGGFRSNGDGLDAPLPPGTKSATDRLSN